jgi:hypothetical protein
MKAFLLSLFLITVISCSLSAQKRHNPKDPPDVFKLVDADTRLPLDSVQVTIDTYNRRGTVTGIQNIWCNKTWEVKGNNYFPEYFEKKGFETTKMPDFVVADLIFYNKDPAEMHMIRMRKKK